jgi:diaminopimelate epimerase
MASSPLTKSLSLTVTSFSKYSGCGNDFILIDNRENHFPHADRALIARLCHRQCGIGADGLILLERSLKADYRMRIFNADGGEAEMCGNGIRCLIKFIRQLGGLRSHYLIETMHSCLRTTEKGEKVSVEMPEPQAIRVSLSLPTGALQCHYLNTGVPHAVIFVDELQNDDWMRMAPLIRNHEAFGPAGTNVNFASLDPSGAVWVRTYERGVEGETLACGTGATATALAAGAQFGLPSPIQVFPRSGEPLDISFCFQGDSFSQVSMAGSAHFIFRGEFLC